jgi:transglutaminase-like putative cysteine protease
MTLIRLVIAASLAVPGCRSFAAEIATAKVRQAPVPVWVQPIDDTGLASKGPSPGGMEFLLVESQNHVAEHAEFRHVTYRISSDTGVQQGSQLTLDFDPDYSSIDFHFIRLIRAGRTTDRLNLGTLKILQQERELERQLYNGRLTVLAVLDDVRVGDIVDYAFTRRGTNPIFDGRYIDDFFGSWGGTVRHQRNRLLLPPERVVSTVAHGDFQLGFTVNPGPAYNEYLWEGRDLKPVSAEPDTPAWFPTYGFMEVTEFPDWASVVNWALPLYDNKAAQTPELRAKAEELTRGQSTYDKKVLALLDFVQRDVRYLGLELGPGSHRPNPPASVLSQRFGDCKDKVRLFCALLQDIGVEASPALVNSVARDSLLKWLPSPYAFDHVIARIKLNGHYFWLDPTATYQRGGDLTFRSAPDYSPALVVAPGTTGLTAITVAAPSVPRARIVENFSVSAFDHDAQLDVTTNFSGPAAERIRAYLAQNSAEDYASHLLNFYARAYPDIRTRVPPAWEDREDANMIILRQSYLIPKLWKVDKSSGRQEAVFFPLYLRTYVQSPNSPRRTAPLAIEYPADVKVTTTVQLPLPWPLKPVNRFVNTDAFSFQSSFSSSANVVTMVSSWRSATDFVPAPRVADYIAQLDSVRESLGFTLTHNPQLDTEPGIFALNWTLILLGLCALAGSGFGAWRVYHHWAPVEDSAVSAEASPSGIGGWLALVAVALVLRPVFLIVNLVLHGANYFSQRVWLSVTVPGQQNYSPAFGPMLAFEVVANILMIVLSLLALTLFIQKRRRFPTVMITLLALAAGFAAIDTWVARSIPSSSHSLKAAAQSLGAACIWIPYFLVSRRVKNTFVY